MNHGYRTLGAGGGAFRSSDGGISIALGQKVGITPEQWLGIYKNRGSDEGIVALAVAITEDAIRCIGRRPRAASHLNCDAADDAAEASRWVDSRDDRPFSFAWIIGDVLGCDVDNVRAAIHLNGPAIAALLSSRRHHQALTNQRQLRHVPRRARSRRGPTGKTEARRMIRPSAVFAMNDCPMPVDQFAEAYVDAGGGEAH